MSTSFLPETDPARPAVAALFTEKPPVLVEVRFPNMGTAPDWYLCEDENDLVPILDRLGSGVEIHLRSVWDLRGAAEPVVLRK
jgi:hypothetical protein